MRMRKKKNLIPRMERCAAVQEKDPYAMRGRWREWLTPECELCLEIGCGKGAFIRGTAVKEPDVNFIALERCSDVAMIAMEKCKAAEIPNVRFMIGDVAKLAENFTDGSIDRIYLNFSDPWPSNRHAKRRLTHRTFLDKYCRTVREGGEIHFKTDNAPLFAYSLEEFAACGLEVKNVTHDLHKDGIVGIMTGYEEKFHALGTPINRCEIVCKPFVLPPEEKKQTEGQEEA